MPRPIHVAQGEAGISSYTLSPHEEWTLLAVTFSIVPQAGSGGDDFAWLDYRDPAGGIIMLQPLTPADGGNMFYSLAVGASEFVATLGNPPYFPQYAQAFTDLYSSQRLTKQTLYTGCTVNAYKTTFEVQSPTDPITAVNPAYTIPDLHLWVEDTAASIAAAGNSGSFVVGPYQLVLGPSA